MGRLSWISGTGPFQPHKPFKEENFLWLEAEERKTGETQRKEGPVPGVGRSHVPVQALRRGGHVQGLQRGRGDDQQTNEASALQPLGTELCDT